MILLHYSNKELYKFVKAKKLKAKHPLNAGISTSLISSIQMGITAGLFVLDAFGLALSYFPAYSESDKDISNVRIITASVIGSLTLIVAVPVAIYNFRKSYAAHRETERKIQLAELKIPIYKELVRRELECLPEKTQLKLSKLTRPNPPKEIKYNKLKLQAVKSSALAASSLFGTYIFLSFYGLTFVGLAGVAAVLTAPLGIGIAIGVTLVLAGLISLCRYHQLKTQKEQTHKLSSLNSTIDSHEKVLNHIKQSKMEKPTADEKKLVGSDENKKHKINSSFFAVKKKKCVNDGIRDELNSVRPAKGM